MKFLHKKKTLLTLFFILIIIRTLTWTSYNEKFISEENAPKAFITQYTNNDVTVILPKSQIRLANAKFNNNLNWTIMGILNSFLIWELILSQFNILNILIIDRRKRIIQLITRYLEGGKYKDSPKLRLDLSHIIGSNYIRFYECSL